MPDIVITDTSCLILFEKIGELNLIYKLYGNILTTQEVAKEFLRKLPSWVKIEEVTDKKYQEF